MGMLHKIYVNPTGLADVIFVHGLGGDGYKTWQHSDKDSYWPAWLGQDIPNLNVYSIDYELSPTDWRSSTMPMTERAINLLNLCHINGIGSRPLVFVCHSMGGLMVKQMLRSLNDNVDPGLAPMLENVRGVSFIATPHTGSGVANWINLAKFLLRTSVSVKELQRHEPTLLNLNNWYRDNAAGLKLRTQCFCETRSYKGVTVVDPASANPGIAGVPSTPLDENHVSITKPESRGSQLYLAVKLFVNQLFADCLGKQAQSDSSAIVWPQIPESHDDTIANNLADRKSIVAQFKAMLSGQSQQRVLLIEGDSAAGKTLLTRELVKYARQLQVNSVRLDLKGCPTLKVLVEEMQLDLPQEVLPSLSLDNDQSQSYRLTKDLQNTRSPLLLVLDTYEKASQELKDWVDRFLRRIDQAPAVILVIAGQQVPELDDMSANPVVQHQKLGPIDDVNDWLDFCQRRWPQAGLGSQQLETLARATAGNPGSMYPLLQRLAEG